ERVAADRVQLRVELDLQHAVADIDQARARVAPEYGRRPNERSLGVGRWELAVDSAKRLEWPQLPAGAPPHRAIDVVVRVCDLVGDLRDVLERRTQRRAEERADLVLAVIQRADPLAGVFDPARRIERGQLRRLLRAVVERREIERQDVVAAFAIE